MLISCILIEIDECGIQPCVHGVCEDRINSYTCDCTGTGYEGINCDTG